METWSKIPSHMSPTWLDITGSSWVLLFSPEEASPNITCKATDNCESYQIFFRHTLEKRCVFKNVFKYNHGPSLHNWGQIVLRKI